MDLKEISQEFLKWEREHELYKIKVNHFPIYTFMRMEIYESIMFKSSLGSILNKEKSKQVKKISYIKVLKSAFGFIVKQHQLKNSSLYITNTDNKVKINQIYVDNFFDKIIKQDLSKFSVLEFPNLTNYHFKDIQYKKETVKSGFLYVLEKILKSKVNERQLREGIKKISKFYLQLYHKIHQEYFDENIDDLLWHRCIRNLKRIHIYDKLIGYYRPKVIYLKSAYSPLKQIFIYSCKKRNIKVVEVQHGHIYPYHIGYLLPLNINKLDCLFPDVIYIWSEYYKRILLKNGWSNLRIRVIGDFTYNEELSCKKIIKSKKTEDFKNNYSNIITIISQHTLTYEINMFLNGIEKIPKDTIVLIKLHPRLQLTQEEKFSKRVRENNNLVLVKEGNLKKYLDISDLVIGVYSTAIVEALELGKRVHLIDIGPAYFFEDFINEKIVYKTNNIFSSYEMLSKPTQKTKVVFREPLKKVFNTNSSQ